MNTPNPDSTYRATSLEFERLPANEQRARLAAFQKRMVKRRTVRHYSSEQVRDELIDSAIAVAGSAPSGANLQPWRFVVVRDARLRQEQIGSAHDQPPQSRPSKRRSKSTFSPRRASANADS